VRRTREQLHRCAQDWRLAGSIHIKRASHPLSSHAYSGSGAELKGCRSATPLVSFLSQSFLPTCTFFSGAKPLGSRQAFMLCIAFDFPKSPISGIIFLRSDDHFSTRSLFGSKSPCLFSRRGRKFLCGKADRQLYLQVCGGYQD